ncbi:hypothetical protein NL676_012022 [Syzygium grande]|nr:hypothetical protein NL676_012022 [Syzygium grande]
MGDEDSLPRSDSHDHPTLYEVIDEFHLGTEKLPVRDRIAFDIMFSHWPTSVVQNIQAGHGHYICHAPNLRQACDIPPLAE